MTKTGAYIHVDASDATRLMKELRKVHTDKEMQLLLYRACRRTGDTTKKILKQELPKEYHVLPAQIGREVGRAHTQKTGTRDVICTIPIEGSRGHIGGDGRYKASGGAHGWKAARRKKRYKITAKIVKDHASVLPTELDRHGGNAPFRNLSSPKLNKITFTRNSKAQKPISSVVGIAIPQMPLNRSVGDVQREIANKLVERLEHEHNFMIGKLR